MRGAYNVLLSLVGDLFEGAVHHGLAQRLVDIEEEGGSFGVW